MQLGQKLAQLYDDTTGNFLNETLFIEDIPETLFKDVQVNRSSINGPIENTYKNLFNATEYEQNQQLSLLTELVNYFQPITILGQMSDNAYLPKSSTFYYYTTFERSFNISNPELIAKVNRDYISKSNATHYVSKIIYGRRYLTKHTMIIYVNNEQTT